MTTKKKIPAFWKKDLNGYDPWKNSKGFYFDLETAERVCDFFPEHLKHYIGKWAGKPFELRQWQRRYIGHLFGWKHIETDEEGKNLRRYRKTLLYVPKKNGKTQLASGIALILLLADNEPGAEIYAAAGDVKQANIVFRAAHEMIKQNKYFSRFVDVTPSQRSMEFNANGSVFTVLSSESRTKHGPNVHGLFIDELHVQRNAELIETLEAGTVSRQQPLVVFMTTADHAGPSPCNDEYDYACKVRDGVIKDPEYLPCIYEASVEDDWTSEKVWKRANPNYGITLPPDYFKSLVRKAKERATEENKFKRLHLNIQTKTAKRWLDMGNWDESGAKVKIEELDGKECYAGLDLSSSIDISSFVLYFPEFSACVPRFWVPKGTAEKRIEYEQWEREKYLTITEGDVIDYTWIRKEINALSKQYVIKDIAYDPWNASQMAIKLADDDGLPLIEFRQGFKSFSEPSKEFEKLVIQRELVHFGNPVLRWMASNCSIKEDPAGNIKPIKPSKDSRLKIDGIVALIMAIGLSISKHEEESESVYKERGMLIL